MSLETMFSVALPGWVEPFVDAWSGPLDSDEGSMALAVALSAENVARGTGGPFGAVVADAIVFLTPVNRAEGAPSSPTRR